MKPELPKELKKRLHFIDALRGFAAIAVLFHHLYHNTELKGPLCSIFPSFLDHLLTLGARGVQVFFVISGFVIAYSVRAIWISPANARDFIIRRQLRLDPPYWIILGITILFLRLHPDDSINALTAGTVLANMFYLHKLIGVHQFVSVAWTLCLEVQFYLIFILLFSAAQRASRCSSGNPRPSEKSLLWAIVPVALVSVWVRSLHGTDEFPWFIGSWYLFALGTLAFLAWQGWIKSGAFWAFQIVVLGCGIALAQSGMVVGAITAGAIVLVGRAGHLSDWLSHPIFQYFGRISYSIYLVHLFVVLRVMRIGIHFTHGSPTFAVIWFLLAAGSSVAVAHLFYLLVERPSMELGASFKKYGFRIFPMGIGRLLDRLQVRPGHSQIPE
ncbi:MAG: acyltransferase [Armatimonadota bacterium]|nr:acyltransferase [Armatimonadota bacterium]